MKVKINDGFCEYEYDFGRKLNHVSIQEVAKAIAMAFGTSVPEGELLDKEKWQGIGEP